MSPKIPCVVLVFYNADIIAKTMDFLQQYSDRLDFTVVENKSIHTDSTIKPYLLKLVEERKISRYVLFNENITMNALRMTFDLGLVNLSDSKYVMITDGDLIVNNADFLSEQIHIMDSHPELFACGVSLCTDNLPLNNYPEANTWIPNDITVFEDYIETLTGAHLTLIRSEDFMLYLIYSKQMNYTILDVMMHEFCYRILGKRWGKTKISNAVHLTWDVYADSNHPYQQWKSQMNLHQLFVHDNYCSYEVYESKQ
ncbi:glycosyltransferase family A protein [Paenibacillus sp. sgz500958]|uniref:glycosyltransferase family A protein n=1 Tax=Paenibacillus sp. sgz500958 TaxID=3242475 RepID=UPI0036D2BF2A